MMIHQIIIILAAFNMMKIKAKYKHDIKLRGLLQKFKVYTTNTKCFHYPLSIPLLLLLLVFTKPRGGIRQLCYVVYRRYTDGDENTHTMS